MIPQHTSSPPSPVRLSSASRIISSGWSGSTTAALKKALLPESVNNADPSRPHCREHRPEAWRYDMAELSQKRWLGERIRTLIGTRIEPARPPPPCFRA
jgi:hypothetical protein